MFTKEEDIELLWLALKKAVRDKDICNAKRRLEQLKLLDENTKKEIKE